MPAFPPGFGPSPYPTQRPSAEPDEDARPVETIRDYETGLRAIIMVDALPRRQRNKLYFMRWMYRHERIVG